MVEVDSFTESTVDTARNLYAQFLRILMQKSLITPDDYEVYQQICPLFDPVYVFYDAPCSMSTCFFGVDDLVQSENSKPVSNNYLLQVKNKGQGGGHVGTTEITSISWPWDALGLNGFIGVVAKVGFTTLYHPRYSF